ncbi:MAG: DUF6465 family protein [Eubacteriales bacterium]|nr:DUF6465 family protein [Eubacteriales bacterium]
MTKTTAKKTVTKAPVTKEAVSKAETKSTVKTEPEKKEETKAIVKQEAGKIVPVKKEEAKAAPAKETKAPAKKTETKAAPARKAAKPVEAKAEISIQFAGKDYTSEKLVEIARDVWQYDLGKKPEDFRTVELYVKPEESAVYYVINGTVTGSFAI